MKREYKADAAYGVVITNAPFLFNRSEPLQLFGFYTTNNALQITNLNQTLGKNKI
jgi:hypothetical protein